jgi:hypothetical protein
VLSTGSKNARQVMEDKKSEPIKNNTRNAQAQVNVQKVDTSSITQFRMRTKAIYNGVYKLDTAKQCLGKPLWRSDNGMFIMFWAGTGWVLTFSKYEGKIGPLCGGIVSVNAEFPYANSWNSNDITIEIL